MAGFLLLHIFRVTALFELCFLVFDVLARNRIKFQNLDFFGSGALVLRGCVKVPGSRRGFQFYFLSHDYILVDVLTGNAACLNEVTSRTRFCQHRIDAMLVDCAQRTVADAQADPAILAFNPESTPLQIR